VGTVYECDLHDVGLSTFQQIQAQAFRHEKAKMLAQEADGLEAESRTTQNGELSTAMFAKAQLIKRKLAGVLGGSDYEGAVASMSNEGLADGQPSPEALEAQAAALEASAQGQPQAAAQALLVNAKALRMTAEAIRSRGSVIGRLRALHPAVKVIGGLTALGVAGAGINWVIKRTWRSWS
jgi:hypothetical protein